MEIIILNGDHKELHRLKREISLFLNSHLKLSLNPKSDIYPVSRGIDFLGYVFYLNETRLRKRIKQNLCRKIAKLRKRKKPLSEDEFKQTLAAWWGWAKYSDSEYLINKLNKITPYEIKFRR